jgi:hypothetical protein
MKNRNCKFVYSKKNYKCDCCEKNISIGERYLRLNINRKGIFHFCKKCSKNEEEFIKYKIMNPSDNYEEYERNKEADLCYDAYLSAYDNQF